MTAPDIVTEARQLLDAATPGPWSQTGAEVERSIGGWSTVVGTMDKVADAAFIAAAPRLVTGLVAEVERLRGQHDEHEKVVDWADDALARRDARITELIAERDAALAEVERLRALDQRTDPELADTLRVISTIVHPDDADDVMRAARLLGGDR